MGKIEFYEVDGQQYFIPVKVIKEHNQMNVLEVEASESGLRTFVPSVYKISKVNEPQKVVVPKFVAEWIEAAKKCHNNLSWVWFSNPASDELNAWLKNHTETFMRAWLDGYEIEKEQLYTVEIPNPNTNAHTILQRAVEGIVIMTTSNARWRGWPNSKLTESEIKQDFEWAWDEEFAKKVDKNDE
ncbi:TPA: DUF1642 domain-containing protein [Streptococcus suis]|nr:DUF1642 domain-containing protein [Streptococcus suis]HEM5186145.1 DUF1642 domain-containing protein [Streptococcus suis]HEM5200041.1 DUF1642 domain-containing protein [Streptococcus suis]HEM5927137.1 DUF1642 domain-containing protein [Streptococcus suis]HEM5931558.1 DUF1642 domain-containing protein [Streptococcus suis]